MTENDRDLNDQILGGVENENDRNSVKRKPLSSY